MKNGNRNSLLTEITIVILFFALASGTLLKLFTQVFEISSFAAFQTDAVILIQDLGESLKASSDMENVLINRGFKETDNGWTLSQDDFTVTCEILTENSAAGSLVTANLLAKANETVLCVCEASRYYPKEAASE